jgi:molecular chaperone DnaK
MLVADARQAVQDQAPMDRVRELTGELQQVMAGLSAVSAGGPGDAGASVGAGAGTAAGESDDDVIDAEFDRG